MKKTIYILLAALLVLSSVSGCASNDEEKTNDSTQAVNTSTDTDIETVADTADITDSAVDIEPPVKVEFSGYMTIEKVGVDAQIGDYKSDFMLSLLNGGGWIKGTPEGNFIYTFGINDKVVKYDSYKGIIYNETDDQYMNVVEKDKSELNEILGMIFERIYEDW